MIKYYARFNSTDFEIVGDSLNIKDSSREVTFSDLEIDFTGKAETLLPIQYQEVTIVQVDESLVETILMVGYVDLVDYPEFYSASQPFILNISLLSPYAYASKRTITKSFNNIALKTAVADILAPLLEDGFTIEINELSTTKKIGKIFQMETIEKVMNYLANAYDFIWYIDKTKKIYLKDVDSTKGITPILSLTSNNNSYLTTIKPYKTVVDYANKLNLKNLYIITQASLITGRHWFNEGDEYRFDYPFSISDVVSSRTTGEEFFMYDDNTLKAYTIENGVFYNVGVFGVEADIGNDVLVILDDIDKTKVVGFKWNSVTPGTTIDVYTYTQLIPYNVIYTDPVEITAIKSNINTSGVIEKVIDCNGRYFSDEELFYFATSLFKKNSLVTSEVDCAFKGSINDNAFITLLNNLEISKTISINLTDFKINGTFLITSVEKKYGTESIEIKVNARNFNLNENFNDIYRSAFEELNEETKYNMNIFYSKDNETILSKEVYVDGELVNL